MLIDMKKLRAERPDLDLELFHREADAAERFSKWGPKPHCSGIEIAHEGVSALAQTPPGSTVWDCSLGTSCAGAGLPHGDSNVSCRLLLDPCPACDDA